MEAALWQLCLFPASKITRRSISASARDLRAGLRQLAEFRKLWASGVVATVSTRIDVILVGVLAGTFAAGQYATASRIVEALTLLAVALSTVRFNALIEASNDSRRYLAESGSFARLMVGIGVTSMVILALAGPPMVIILYGNEFAPAASVLALYSLTAVPIFYRQFISRVLIIERSYGLSLACNVFTLTLNVSLNLTLVPQFGAMGAATAAVLTYPLGILIPFMATRNGRDILSLSALTIIGPHMRAKTAATRLVHERSNNASFQNTRAIKAG
ncbi:oligosaccharide flippase family protein [Rhodococcus hoagii]|nr:oligosaccharide flippase family protein [Prescottella equi]